MPYIGRAATNTGSVRYLDNIASGFDGSDTTFTAQVGGVSITPDQENVRIYLDGVFQHPGSGNAYTISGSTITFTEAPVANTVFSAYVVGSGAYLDDKAVSSAKLDDDAVTASKLDDDGTGFQVGALGVGGSLTSGDKLTVTGRLRASGGIIGDLTGDVTGNTSGTAATVTGAAQSAITSVGTSLGIGTSSQSSYDSYYNNLVVYEDGHAGISIIGNTSSETSLGFGDGTGAATYRGAVAYVHTSGSHQDKMFFKTAATNQMVIDSSGKLGVGTITPEEMLEVYNATSPAIQLNDGGDYKGILRLAGNDLEIRGSSGTIEFFTGNADGDSSTERMRITSGGYVGIQTVDNSGDYTPQTISAPLHILQKTASQGYGLAIQGNSNTAGARLGIGDANCNFGTRAEVLDIGFDSNTDFIYSRTGKDFIFGVNSAERMRIKSDGKVGIGTTSPDDTLHVSGTSRLNTDTVPAALLIGTNATTDHTGSDSALAIDFRNLSTTNGVAGGIVGLDKDGLELTKVLLVTDNHDSNTGSIRFYTSTNAAQRVEAVRIASDGVLRSAYGMKYTKANGDNPAGDFQDVGVKIAVYKQAVTSSHVTDGYVNFSCSIYRDNVYAIIPGHFGYGAGTNNHLAGFDSNYVVSAHLYAGGTLRAFIGSSVVAADWVFLTVMYYGNTG